MSKQPEALRLAGALYDDGEVPSLEDCSAAAAELRRLHALNAELVEALRECADRLEIHIKHSEDLVAHMKACKALAKATP